jgi:protoheme IX farnesyltransferase
VKSTTLKLQTGPDRLRHYFQLTKPRVVSLIVFCAVIGMFLAVPGMVPWRILVAGTLGIALVAGAAAAANCLIEQKIDALMARTRGRPLPQGEVNSLETLLFSGLIGGSGLFLLYTWVNPFTMWLTFATFVGYAVIYTIFLKPNTSQNIVIGGASGAMPPVLGWAAVTGDAPGEAWLLFLIIFVWTPPHFWSLALYRTKEYAAAGLPMLPVTHGAEYTRRHVFLYTVGLTLITLVPYVIGMAGWFYLTSAVLLDTIFLGYAWLIWKDYSDAVARITFRWSITTCRPGKRIARSTKTKGSRLSRAALFVLAGDAGVAYAASLPFIFCMALTSIWRIRSAETPYSAASSCRVAASSPSATSQRRCTMVRLRSSRLASAELRPSSCRRSYSLRSSIAEGSMLRSAAR